MIKVGRVSWKRIGIILVFNFSLAVLLTLILNLNASWTREKNFKQQAQNTRTQLENFSQELQNLKTQDQYQRNETLQEEIKSIELTYQQTVASYESLLKLKENSGNFQDQDKLFTRALLELSRHEFATAAATLKELDNQVSTQQQKLTASFTIPANVPANNAPPGTGYSRQKVSLDIGEYLVDLIAADVGSTRVIVDTASDNTCTNDCPVLSLADYVARTGAYAGVNGSYFCPAAYPSCSGKTNSFDTLLMNRNKVYFNSDNNVYSTVPAVIFGDGWIRFVGRSLDWGRDTGIDSMIANQPLLVSGSQVVFGGDDDPKKGSKGNRSFVANKGNTVFIGVVYSATVAESARIMAGLGMENALNLDSGGSTALWFGGYKTGPGRNIPNAVLFVRK